MTQLSESDRCTFKHPVRKANSEPELSQLLFISIRQRELVRVLAILSLSTYTTFSWSVHSLSVTLTKLCDIMCHDVASL